MPLHSLSGRIKRKIHTSKNRRFHVFEFVSPNRIVTIIYFGFMPPSVDGNEIMLKGHWRQCSEYGPQFHITHYEPLIVAKKRHSEGINSIYRILNA